MTRDSEWINPVRNPVQSAIRNPQSAIGFRAFRVPRSAFRVVLTLLLFAATARAGAENAGPPLIPPDPASFRAYDQPNDDGSEVGVEWAVCPDAAEGTVYIVEIASEADCAKGEFKPVAEVPAVKASKDDRTTKADYPEYFGVLFSKALEGLHYAAARPSDAYPPEKREIKEPRKEEIAKLSKAALSQLRARLAYERRLEQERLADERHRIDGLRYYFRLAVSDGQRKVYVQENGQPKVVSAIARPNLFKWQKLNNLIFCVLFCGVVLAFIQIARRRPNLFIRRIAGLEAVDEAIGRATEMGRPAFFVHGLAGVGDLPTIAALNILSRVARRAAVHETGLRVFNNDPIVMAISREVVRQAYTEAGHPDAFNPDDVAQVANEQFSYVAAVGGRMVRDRPAAIFLLGYFFAEALLLAETGASTGAIQIAGTDAYTQLPFFITTCDYTLMGEELYAASAYLSREPLQLGSLRGQDVGKAFMMAVFLLGTVLTTAGVAWIQLLFKAFE